MVVRVKRHLIQLISITTRTHRRSLVTPRTAKIQIVRTIDAKAAVTARRAMAVPVGERDIGIRVGANTALRVQGPSHPWAPADPLHGQDWSSRDNNMYFSEQHFLLLSSSITDSGALHVMSAALIMMMKRQTHATQHGTVGGFMAQKRHTMTFPVCVCVYQARALWLSCIFSSLAFTPRAQHGNGIIWCGAFMGSSWGGNASGCMHGSCFLVERLDRKHDAHGRRVKSGWGRRTRRFVCLCLCLVCILSFDRKCM